MYFAGSAPTCQLNQKCFYVHWGISLLRVILQVKPSSTWHRYGFRWISNQHVKLACNGFMFIGAYHWLIRLIINSYPCGVWPLTWLQKLLLDRQTACRVNLKCSYFYWGTLLIRPILNSFPSAVCIRFSWISNQPCHPSIKCFYIHWGISLSWISNQASTFIPKFLKVRSLARLVPLYDPDFELLVRLWSYIIKFNLLSEMEEIWCCLYVCIINGIQGKSKNEIMHKDVGSSNETCILIGWAKSHVAWQRSANAIFIRTSDILTPSSILRLAVNTICITVSGFGAKVLVNNVWKMREL